MRRPLLFCLALVLAIMGSASSAPLDSVFSIQGELREGSSPANGSYDIEASLYNVASGGDAIDVTTAAAVNVTGGLFIIELDYTTVPFEMVDSPSGTRRSWTRRRSRPGVIRYSFKLSPVNSPTFEFSMFAAPDSATRRSARHVPVRLTPNSSMPKSRSLFRRW